MSELSKILDLLWMPGRTFLFLFCLSSEWITCPAAPTRLNLAPRKASTIQYCSLRWPETVGVKGARLSARSSNWRKRKGSFCSVISQLP